MPEAAQYDVFLSHSSHDKPVVQALAERLKQDELQVWFDESDIPIGGMIPVGIEAGLANSNFVIFCMSAHAFKSEWATLESRIILFGDPLNLKLRLLPLLLDDTPIPPSLQVFKYLDWRNPSEEDYRSLLAACRKKPLAPDASLPFGTGGTDASENIDAAITPHCQTLATMLRNPAVWTALQTAKLIAKLETEVRDIRRDRAFTLPTAEALYALCAKPGTDPKRLLRRMTAVVITQEGKPNPQGMATLAHNAVIAICIVLAERVFQAGALAALTVAGHEVWVPIQSEAVATLIAALSIYGDTGVQLEIGLTSEEKAPKALGALNITDTPLEIGYPAADSPADLVKMQIWHKLYAQSAAKPGTAWKNLPMDEFVDTQMAALKSRIRQTLDGDLVCDLVLTLDANTLKSHPAHLMAAPESRREVKELFGIWTVLYGADGESNAALAATAELAKTIENAFNSVFTQL